MAYKNKDPNGDRRPQEILNLGVDLVKKVHDLIEDEGSDMLIILCNLKDELGLAVAQRNCEFKENSQDDLWAFALNKPVYADMMREVGCPSDALRMKPREKQVVVFSAGIAHYFSVEGRYSGVPKNSHWAQFSKKDFHA